MANETCPSAITSRNPYTLIPILDLVCDQFHKSILLENLSDGGGEFTTLPIMDSCNVLDSRFMLHSVLKMR
jgi:hypothetical protein